MSAYTAQILQVVIGFFGALVLCRAVIALKINDLPDGKRKLQKAPVPSAGGLGIAAAGIAGWVAALIGMGVEVLPYETYILLITALAGLVLGLVDDMGFVGTKAKLLLLLAICVAAASQIYVAQPYWIQEYGPPPLNSMPAVEDNWSLWKLILLAGSALWLFVVINAVNFMDGSNGLMAGSLAIMMAGVIVITLVFLGSEGLLERPYLAINTAICGFLFLNLQGRLYAGDAGALFLGGIFAAGALLLVRDGSVSVFTPATFALPFLVDIILTVAWRARRGKNILHAHRDHAYQLFVRAGWPHWKVALLWWAGSIACVLVGVVAFMMRGPFPAIAFVVGLLLGSSLWYFQRRYFKPRLGL